MAPAMVAGWPTYTYMLQQFALWESGIGLSPKKMETWVVTVALRKE